MQSVRDDEDDVYWPSVAYLVAQSSEESSFKAASASTKPPLS
jgi:hypothetical protein